MQRNIAPCWLLPLHIAASDSDIRAYSLQYRSLDVFSNSDQYINHKLAFRRSGSDSLGHHRCFQARLNLDDHGKPSVTIL
jgi:hypothetical protein